MDKILDGKAVADKILLSLKQAVLQSRKRPPSLAVVLVGNDPASAIYVERKTKACQETLFHSIKKDFLATVDENTLASYIQELNANPEVDGILVQLPLPPHIDEKRIITLVDPQKDVDGFHPVNLGKLVIEDPSGFVPCTPFGIKMLLVESGIDLTGKNVVIIGRSLIVGKPLALLLMQKEKGMNATVTVVHSKTLDLSAICQKADVLIAAIGKPLFVKEDMVKEGAVVIDVGINRLEDPAAKKGYRIVGDVDFETVVKKAAHITKVPGGIGPMTIAMLLFNTFKSWKAKIL
jgi:methylenetetrahydrofolate dehydrogenase (NADP+) / methenyltetrahydrofolate cyclohydrolase